MDATVLTLLAVVVLVFALWRSPLGRKLTRAKRRAGAYERLQATYRRKLNLPRAQADAVMTRQLAALEERFPNRTPVWRMRKLLSELERARR